MRILWFAKKDDYSSFFLFLRAISPCANPTWGLSKFCFDVFEYFGNNEPEDMKVLLIVDASHDGYQSVIAHATEDFGPQNIVVVALVSPDNPPLTGVADMPVSSILIDRNAGASQVAAQIEELFRQKGLQRPVVAEDSAISP
jgi:hypothetical protein